MPRPSLLRRVLAVLLVVAGAAGALGQQPRLPPDPALPFEVERPLGGIPIFVLGLNRFTPQQLSGFVAGIEPFLRRAEGVAPGEQLVWRQDGVRGYISLSTSPFAEGPAFLLTLRGEPVRTLEDAAAVLDTMTRLAVRLLGEAPFAADPAPRTRGPGAPQILTP